MFDFFKNTFLNRNKYKTHSEAVIISCYFNPQRSSHRLEAFKHYYESIKHLNHLIVECVIGDDLPQLTSIVPSDNRKTFYTKNLLWHKESLLNQAIKRLPEKYKYVFWIDADVIFSNKNWMPEAVELMDGYNIVQLFEWCINLNEGQLKPGFDVDSAKAVYHRNLNSSLRDKKYKETRMWRSFAYNWNNERLFANSESYDTHGHVGFAWGAKRSCLEQTWLYDKALIGGADHIMAHACVGQIPHKCITKSFADDIDDVNRWSKKFFMAMQGRLGCVSGDLYHIWHGDVNKRQYLKRIVEFTPKAKQITKRDNNGLYITDDVDTLNYMTAYFIAREVMEDDSCNEMFHHHKKQEEEERQTRKTEIDVNDVSSSVTTIVDEVVNHSSHSHHHHHDHESHHHHHNDDISNNSSDSTHVNHDENFS